MSHPNTNNSVLEIRKSDLQRFIAELTLCLSSPTSSWRRGPGEGGDEEEEEEGEEAEGSTEGNRNGGLKRMAGGEEDATAMLNLEEDEQLAKEMLDAAAAEMLDQDLGSSSTAVA